MKGTNSNRIKNAAPDRPDQEWRRFELRTDDQTLIQELRSVIDSKGLTRRDLALITEVLRVRPEFSIEDFDT